MRKLDPVYMVLEGPNGNVFYCLYGNKLTYHDRETGETGEYKLIGYAMTHDNAQEMIKHRLITRGRLLQWW